MDAPHGAPGDPRELRFDQMLAEAREALAYGANTLRAVRERFRTAYADDLARWESLRDELAERDRRPAPSLADEPNPDDPLVAAAVAAEAGADDAHRRALRTDVSLLGAEVGRHQSELGRLDLAITNLERTWLFLERDDQTLVTDAGTNTPSPDVQMRLVEAQEGERARLAQEVHDGPAQTLTNAIFQVEYVERVLPRDPNLAQTELRFLRELLRRELNDVRSFITQLRPPVLLEQGLDPAITEAAGQLESLAGVPVSLELGAPTDRLTAAEQTVVLRIIQEAIQNVRKHASASSVRLRTALDNGAWQVELTDDGRGFDITTVAARGRRNFGLQFMRERAELIGADFEVRSRPDRGTVVRLAIPMTEQEGS